MKTSSFTRGGLAFAVLLGVAVLPACGGGGSTTVPTTTTTTTTSSNGSVPISSLNMFRPASNTPVNVTGSIPAGPTVDVNDRAALQMNASAGGDASLISDRSQHTFAGSLHGQTTASARRSPSDSAVNSPNDLSYHGGVVVGSAVSHNIFINSSPAARQSLNFAPGRFLADLNNDPFITLLYQYLSGPGVVDSTPITGRYTKGTAADVSATYASPRPGSSNPYYGQLSILLAVLNAAPALGGSGYGQIYHVFLPQNVDTCQESPLGTPTTSCYSPDNGNTFFFCAYHGSFTSSGQIYLYTVEPYQDVSGCRNNVHNQALPQAVSATVDPADPGYSTLSHELFETITDPRGSSWWNQFTGGQEIGDICAEFDNFVTVGGDKFVLQSEYSDVDHLCVSANLTTGTPPQTPQTVQRAVH